VSNLVNPPNARLPLVDKDTGLPSNVGMNFLQGITSALNGTDGVAATGVAQITLGIGTKVSAGSGSPSGVVVGNPGDLYLNLLGGALNTLWVKESGTDASGWAAK
jgi:hypothetical protein